MKLEKYNCENIALNLKNKSILKPLLASLLAFSVSQGTQGNSNKNFLTSKPDSKCQNLEKIYTSKTIKNKRSPQDYVLFNKGKGFRFDRINSLNASIQSPRNQTEQRVLEQEYILGLDFVNKFPVILPDRIAFNPKLINKLNNPEEITIPVTFEGGKNGLKNCNQYNQNFGKVKELNSNQFQRLEYTLKELRTKLPEVEVLISPLIADSKEQFSITVASNLYSELKTLSLNYKSRLDSINFGGDESVVLAYAKNIPKRLIEVTITNPNSRQRYEADTKVNEIVESKLKSSGLENSKVNSKILNSNKLYALIISKEDNSKISYQKIEEYLSKFSSSKLLGNKNLESNLVIIDTVLPNGTSFDLIRFKDLFKKYNIEFEKIHFHSWGTAANALGEGFSTLKIDKHYIESNKGDEKLIQAKNAANFAHDFIFLNQKYFPKFESLLSQAAGRKVKFRDIQKSGAENISSPDQRLFEPILNKYINEELQKFFPGKYIKFQYQLDRHFEASIRAVDKEGNFIIPITQIFQEDNEQTLKLQTKYTY